MAPAIRVSRTTGTMATDVFEMASQGRLDPLIERILPFDELVDGLKTLAAGKVTGKLVVSLDS